MPTNACALRDSSLLPLSLPIPAPPLSAVPTDSPKCLSSPALPVRALSLILLL